MKWISVKDALPEIPEGKFGISIITAEYDPVYNEDHPKKPVYFIHEHHFGYVNYEKMPLFIGSRYPDGEPAFMECNSHYQWGPTGDKVTHWMYLPAQPQGEPK